MSTNTYTVIGGPKHGERIALRPSDSARYVEFPRMDFNAFMPYQADVPAYATIRADRYEKRRVEMYGIHIADILVHETVNTAPRLTIR